MRKVLLTTIVAGAALVGGKLLMDGKPATPEEQARIKQAVLSEPDQNFFVVTDGFDMELDDIGDCQPRSFGWECVFRQNGREWYQYQLKGYAFTLGGGSLYSVRAKKPIAQAWSLVAKDYGAVTYYADARDLQAKCPQQFAEQECKMAVGCNWLAVPECVFHSCDGYTPKTGDVPFTPPLTAGVTAARFSSLCSDKIATRHRGTQEVDECWATSTCGPTGRRP